MSKPDCLQSVAAARKSGNLSGVTDLVLFLKAHGERAGDQFDLSQLLPGDELKVVTSHTEYLFKIIDDRVADLTCSRFDRPHARVMIMGCTFGKSTSIKPLYLFCGGNLEFRYDLDSQPMVHRTTAIRSIELRRRKGSDQPKG